MFVFKIGGHFWKIMVAFWSSLVKLLISKCFLWQRLFILLRSRSTFKVKRYFLWSRCTFLFDRRLFWFWLFMTSLTLFKYQDQDQDFYFSLIHFLFFYSITPLNFFRTLFNFSFRSSSWSRKAQNPLKKIATAPIKSSSSTPHPPP